ncbi:MAG: tandem-95 repeat protein, partial [Planctomycetales bacterium]|nr:tandem-95 repeat protein [Planctomycetales bacterium]
MLSFQKINSRHKRKAYYAERLENRNLLAGDLIAHWIADSVRSEIADGATLTDWNDQVSSIQTEAKGEPKIIRNQVGGRSVVRFSPSDGADSFFVDSKVSPVSGIGDFSVVVVFRTDSSELVGQNGDWFKNTGIVDANNLGFGQDWGMSINATGQLATGLGAGLGSPPKTVYSTTSGVNNGELHTAVVTRSGSNLSLAIDDIPADQINDGPATDRSKLDLVFGGLTNGNPFTGDIAEVRIYNGALSGEEASAVRSQIDAYYGNVPPTAIDDAYELQEDAVLFAVSAGNGVLANDSDADGDSLTVELVQPPAVGALNLNSSGAFVYTAPRDFYGTVTFSYVAIDHRASEPATVTLNVTPKYDPPRPEPDSYRMRPNTTLRIPGLVGLLANDKNPDDASLTVRETRAVNAGVLTLGGDGSFTYDPQGFEGVASFAYEVDDGTQITGPVEVIIAVNTPPESTDDSYTTDEDQSLIVDAANGVIANDTDAQADNELTATLVSPPSNGELELSPDGSFTYTPGVEYSGSDSFQYRLFDGFESSDPATVVIEVNNVDDSPIAADDAYFTLPEQALTVPASNGLLSNDVDIEGQPITARLDAQPQNGTVTVEADGAFQYKPNAGFVGRDAFSYVANDGSSNSESTSVSIEVNAQPITISEFLAVNNQSLPTRIRATVQNSFRGDDQFEDWIELHNQLDVDLNVSGTHLTDDRDEPTKWQFPLGTVVPANGYLVVFASGENVLDTNLDEQNLLHTNFQLGSNGEYLALNSPGGELIDEFNSVPDQFANYSYGRIGDGISYFATPTPGEPNVDAKTGRASEVTVSVGHGFYTEPLTVTLSSDNQNATIRYTIDGSIPTGENGSDYNGPITVSSTTTLRAAALDDALLPGVIATNTYIFLDDIILQSPDGSAPEGWPTRPVRGQAFDYGMDPNIVNDPQWGPQLHAALTQIPSVSIVTPLENLIDDREGIYVNASRDGREWEREASIEMIYPDQTEGFQIDAGLRIRGGFSRGAFNPKHSFRLFFRDDYEGPLEYALFEDEGTDQFQAVDLRTAQNYAWSNDTFNDQTRNSFLRDIYSRDLQKELGQQYTRGRYYHLYLNGQYWGMYQTEERPEATFAETYFGGNAEDYDVVKASGGVLEATDGELEPWNDLWRIANAGFDSLEGYFFIQGKNPDGTDNPDLEVHVQIDNVIDFAINYMFTGNQDMPTSLGNSGANNFWAIRDPDSRDGWQFIAHDSEHNMLLVNDDQTKDDPAGNVITSFNPKYLHQQLDALPEYRLRFADRIHKHFFNGGAVTKERAQALLQHRVDQIDQAIIAESAYWGDQHNEPALDKNTWLMEVDWLLNDFLGTRTQTVLDQYRRRDLYPDVVAAEFNQHGGVVDSQFMLGIAAPAGTIYYTLDGNDPRVVGGAVNPDAITWTVNAGLRFTEDTVVKARVLQDGEWSALTEATFEFGEAVTPTALRISEIHYHPSPPTDAETAAGHDNDDDFEFIELVNTSDQPIDLARAKLVRIDVDGQSVGVDFDFANGDIQRLGAGQRIVVVEDAAAFAFRYGTEIAVAGQWSGGLSNAGEHLTVTVDGNVLQQFSYDDAWHEATDGAGPSLEIINSANPDLASWAVAASWRASFQNGGSPGTASRVTGDVNGDGVFNSSDLVAVFQAGKYEDGIPNNATFEEGDWNG